MLGDESAHGMAYDVGFVPSGGVHQGEGVIGELLDGELIGRRLAAADATVVEAEAVVVGSEGVDLRLPAVAFYADALDEENGRATAGEAVMQTAALMFQFRHGIYMK